MTAFWGKRVGLVSCAALVLMTACNGQKPVAADAGEKKAPKPIPIAVTRVEVGPAHSVYTTTATLEAEHHAEVRVRTTGVIRSISHEEGDRVEAGDVLMQLENEDQELGVKQARIRLAQMEQVYDRGVKMREAGIMAPEDFEQAENNWKSAKANLEVAELALAHTTIKAPLSGKVVRRFLDRGAHVQSGTVVFEIMDMSPLLVRVHVPANQVGNVAEGQPIDVRLDSNNAQMQAVVRLVSPIVDPDTGTVKITAEIKDYPANTRAGDFAEVHLVTDRRDNAMLVPSVAVFEEQGRRVLYVTTDGKAFRRNVVVGFMESGKTEILSGIEAGDLIVTKGQRNLRDGLPVEILEGPDDQTTEEQHKEGVGS